MGNLIRGYHWSSESRYRNMVEKPEIMFGLYYDDEDGGCGGEIAMRWYELNGKF